MPSFVRLSAWRRAHALALYVLSMSDRAADASCRTVVDRLRRTAIGIPIRIATGAARRSPRDFAAELQGALGETRALVALAMLALDLEVITRSDFARLEARVDELRRIVVALCRRLDPPSPEGPPGMQGPRSSTRWLRRTRPETDPRPTPYPAG